MRWRCRLEGGPFDGDQGTIQPSELPEKMWVYRCPDCSGIHWAFEEELRSELYIYDRIEDGVDGHVAVYVYSDCDLRDLPVIRECVAIPA